MGEGRAITGLDRLPWLADEGDVRRGRKGRGRFAWIVLLILGVAALSYWLGTRSWNLFPDRPADALSEVSGPIPLPEARPATPEPEVILDPVVEPAPLPAEPVIARTPTVRVPAPPAAKAESGDKASAEVKTGPPEPWPVRKVDGSAGRLVQIGTFSTRRQAKQGWTAIMRINPALQRLPALVVPVRSKRNNKIYYRLQMGTTSQAHSVVLCQRMRMIGQSCIVRADTLEKTPE
jgi:hypothetical protein